MRRTSRPPTGCCARHSRCSGSSGPAIRVWSFTCRTATGSGGFGPAASRSRTSSRCGRRKRPRPATRTPRSNGRAAGRLRRSGGRGAGDGGRRGAAMDDLLIRGGHLIDGTGAPGRDGDVSVSAGRIVAIERRASRPAHREIDARGQVVAPGLIDIHTHSDFTLPLNPRAESKVRQGVTLEVVGNCGFSAAPAMPERLAMLREYLAPSAPGLGLSETTFADYVAAFPATSVNVIFQVGHNTLRLMTAGMESRPVTAKELTEMERLLAEALAAGAAYSSHVRDEANRGREAVREAVAVAEATGVHVQIAHLKLSGIDNWGGAGRMLEEIAAARRRGLPVDCDAYPYDTATNPLRNLLPRWIVEGG